MEKKSDPFDFQYFRHAVDAVNHFSFKNITPLQSYLFLWVPESGQLVGFVTNVSSEDDLTTTHRVHLNLYMGQ